MITYGKNARDGVKLLNVYEIKGLSTDEKPTDVGNGSLFLEMDTAQVFFFDGESGMWINVGTIGGSGGGDTSAFLERINELLAENTALGNEKNELLAENTVLDNEKRTLATLNGEYQGYLADIATAISDKGGVVPADYADYDTAIEELPNGVWYELLEEGFTKHYSELTNVNKICSYAFISTHLESVDFPNCSVLENFAFNSANKLTTVNLPQCEVIGGFAFSWCAKLTEINIPNCKEIKSCAFQKCYSLPMISLPKCEKIANWAFCECTKLSDLRLLGSTICTLEKSSAFYDSRMDRSSYGGYGSIFVRASMLEEYKQATNWAYFSSRFVGLTDEEIANL